MTKTIKCPVREIAAELRYLRTQLSSNEIAVRLQITEDGKHHVHYGDSSYDPDHRGVWGADEIPEGPFDSIAMARRMWNEAVDMAVDGFAGPTLAYAFPRPAAPRRTENDEEGSWTWTIPEVGKLTMSNAYVFSPTGHTTLNYMFTPKGWDHVLFNGNDYGVPSHQAIDSLAAALALLSFLTLGLGDTDEDYFASYSPAQLEWRDSPAREHASCVVYTLEEKVSK